MNDSGANAEAERLSRGMALGDESAYADYFARYAPRLKASLLAATRGDDDLAAEALQITLVKVARAVKPFASEPEFFAWQHRIAMNALRDLIRQRVRRSAREQRHAELDPPGATSQAGPAGTMDLLLEEAVAELPAEERDLIAAYYFDGESQAAIAGKHQMTPKAVEGRLARIRAKLRDAIQRRLKRYDESETRLVN